MEVLLVLGLIVALAGVTVVGFAGWHDAAALGEGGRRVEALLRAARAEAAVRGCKLRLEFTRDDDDPRDAATLVVMWEPDPAAAPGEWFRFTGGMWESYLPDELICVGTCRLTGPSAYRTLTFGSDVDEAFQPVTFYPDGSSDSAEILLISRDPDDGRGVKIELNGLIGSIRSTTLDVNETEAFLAGE